ncbi:RAD52 family DNA repair protein, partial [bacterium]|nr:RAD52 family DNA repair protein [bacterium]
MQFNLITTKMKKNNEVATVTTQELSLVDNMLLNTKQVGLLTKRTPAKYLMTRPAKGGGQWTYVTGAYMKKVLNLMFGFNWNFEVVEYKFDLDIKQAFVLGKLTCKTGNAEIIKMQ